MNCFVHPEEAAVAQCQQCGHGLCKNCGVYGSVCRDCAEKAQMECAESAAMENLNAAVAFKDVAVKARKKMVRGLIGGGIVGLLLGGLMMLPDFAEGRPQQALGSAIFGLFICICVGGALGGFFARTLRAVVERCGGWQSGFVVALFIMVPLWIGVFFFSPIVIAVRFFVQKSRMDKGDGMIEEANRALAALHECKEKGEKSDE